MGYDLFEDQWTEGQQLLEPGHLECVVGDRRAKSKEQVGIVE